jgi:glycosyl transferase family 25
VLNIRLDYVMGTYLMKSYVINLEQDTARMGVIGARFQALGLGFERIKAVDGRQMSDAAFDAFVKARISKKGGWGRAQAGCFLSHYRVWTEIAQGDAPHAAIFEDDVHLAHVIADVFKDDSWLPKPFDIVRLETSTNRVLLDQPADHSVLGRSVHRLRSASWCAGAYILSRECAQKLLAAPLSRHTSVDHFLFSFESTSIAGELTIYQVRPALATQDKFLGDKQNALGFSSNIEAHSVTDRLVMSLKKIRPLVLYKTIKGFKRVPFQP